MDVYVLHLLPENLKAGVGGGGLVNQGFLFMTVDIRPCDMYDLECIFLKRASSSFRKKTLN